MHLLCQETIKSLKSRIIFYCFCLETPGDLWNLPKGNKALPSPKMIGLKIDFAEFSLCSKEMSSLYLRDEIIKIWKTYKSSLCHVLGEEWLGPAQTRKPCNGKIIVAFQEGRLRTEWRLGHRCLGAKNYSGGEMGKERTKKGKNGERK